jgi:hypothetical protein
MALDSFLTCRKKRSTEAFTSGSYFGNIKRKMYHSIEFARLIGILLKTSSGKGEKIV